MTDNMRSCVEGLILALCGKAYQYPTAEPVAYLYNGVRLPKLPEWDKTVHPFAYISEMGGEYFLVTARIKAYDTSIIVTPGLVSSGRIQVYEVVDGAWIETADASSMNHTIVWCNHNIVGADEAVVLHASEPIPVYE